MDKRKEDELDHKYKKELDKLTDPIFNKSLQEARKQGKVKRLTASPDFYFSIISLIRIGKKPTDICRDLRISKQNLSYYLKPLKIDGILLKKGYGVWAINEEKYQEFLKSKEVKKSSAVASPQLQKVFTSKPIRGHGFQFTLKIPKLDNWGKREEFLRKNNIGFKPIGSNWKGQRILVRGHKVWLTPVSIVIYAPKAESWFAVTAEHSKNHAIYDFLQLVRSVENLLKVSFENKKKYLFKVTRQHYGIVRNALAIQYDKEHKKLFISNPRGQWFVIDNSYNLHEAETLSPETAVKDMDNVAKPLFDDLDKLQVPHKEFFGEPANATEILNDAKDYFDTTSETLTLSKVLDTITSQSNRNAEEMHEIRNVIKELAEADKHLAVNWNAHIPAIQSLNESAKSSAKSSKDLSRQVGRIAKVLEKIQQSSPKTPPKPPKKPIKARKYGLSDKEMEKIRNLNLWN